VSDEDLRAWVLQQVERVEVQIQIDMCQAAIESLKARLAKLQQELVDLK
jgi:predicted kinase